MPLVVQTNNLTKTFGKARGIKNVSIDIEEGEIFGFIGPNGAGKSTTIRTLLGLIHPTSGSATIFGKDIRKYGPQINEEIGYLPSEVFYYDTMRAIDLLKYSASFYKKDPKKIDEKIHSLATSLNLDLTKKIDDLSYGNKKKVGIIQGLLHEPKLIILDEPTGGLDPLVQQTFFNLLHEENKRGATILFSSHNLNEIQRLCHRVAIIREGEIVAIEKIRNLVENNYKRFKVETVKKIDKEYFASTDGVSALEITDTTVSFLYRGSINIMTKLLAKLDLTDVLIEEPDLEEIFLHYYKKDQ